MSPILPQISLKSIVSIGLAAGLLAAQVPLGVVAQAQAGPPVLTAISPSSATVGSRMTIFGSGFTSFNTINYIGSFASGTSTAAFAAGDSMVTFIPSTLPPDTYHVTVSTTRGQTSNALPLQVFGVTPSPTPSPTPTIAPTPTPTISPTPTPTPSGVFLSSITPQSANTGQRIALFGGGFTSFNTINYVGSFASGTSVAASATGTSVATFVPATLPSDIYQVSFTTTRGQTSNALPLQVFGVTPSPTPSPTPTIAPTPTPPPRPIYTALGDSLAVGAIAFRGYVPRYRDHIEKTLGIVVSLDNLGRLGQTSTQLAAAVQFDPLFRQAIAQADFLTWNTGGNDMRAARDLYKLRTCGGPLNQQCLEQAVSRFKTNWNTIVNEIIRLRQDNTVIIRTMDIYNPFVNEDQAVDTVPGDGGENDYDELQPFVNDINQHIAASLTLRQIPFANVSDVFNGPDNQTDPHDLGFLSFDGFHPNDAGHRVMAELLRQLGFGLIPTPPPLATLSPTPTLAPQPVPIF